VAISFIGEDITENNPPVSSEPHYLCGRTHSVSDHRQ